MGNSSRWRTSTPLSLIFRPWSSSNQYKNFQTLHESFFPSRIVFTMPHATSVAVQLEPARWRTSPSSRPSSFIRDAPFVLPPFLSGLSSPADPDQISDVRLDPFFFSVQNKAFNPAFLAAVITGLIGPRLTFPLGAAADADCCSRLARGCLPCGDR